MLDLNKLEKEILNCLYKSGLTPSDLINADLGALEKYITIINSYTSLKFTNFDVANDYILIKSANTYGILNLFIQSSGSLELFIA